MSDEKIKNIAYKFRLYPNKSQTDKINRNIAGARKVYNALLGMIKDDIDSKKKEILDNKNIPEEERNNYEFSKEEKSYIYQILSKRLNYNDVTDDKENKVEGKRAKKKPEFEWLNDCDSIALSYAGIELGTAFKNWKSKRTGFPNFHRKSSEGSYTTSNDSTRTRIRFTDNRNKVGTNHIVLLKFNKDPIKVKVHRPIPDNYIIKSATISRTASNEYYISILCEYENNCNVEPSIDIEKSVGLDFSPKSLYIDNTGNSPDYEKVYKNYTDKLAKEQRKLSRMIGVNKGEEQSKNFKEQRRKIAKIHQHIANCRKNFNENESKRLAQKYDLVCIEDLSIKGMTRAKLKEEKINSKNGQIQKYKGEQQKGLTKSILASGWNQFVTCLERKCKKVQKVDRFFPSSKTCHNCGHKYQELELKDRIWVCPECGEILDRDTNAAQNIRDEGIRIYKESIK